MHIASYRDLKPANAMTLASATSTSGFWGKIKDAIWPIYKHELPKFLSITALLFCLQFIQNLVRALKDSIVNTMMGPETVSFLKFWGVLPSSILVMILYMKLVNSFKGENIFYVVLISFLVFFAIFGFVIFPNYHALHLKSNISEFSHFKWFVTLISNWGFSLFYIIAELWPNTMLALLFWQFVNQVTEVEQSKRFYASFHMLSQTGLYISGKFLMHINDIAEYFVAKTGYITDSITLTVQLILSVVIILGLVGLYMFWFLNHRIIKINPELLDFRAKHRSISVIDSLRMAINSRYIRLIMILLVCYGMSINLVEGPWKAQATKLYNDPALYAAFVGEYLSATGIATIIFVVIGNNVIRKIGWRAAAMITPFIVFSVGTLFFAVSNISSVRIIAMAFVHVLDPTFIALALGTTQNVIGKACKYAIFEPTKEMAYVPLDDELKTRGKAAIDVIGSKLGKSMSAFIQSFIFIVLPQCTYDKISIYLMGIFMCVCIVWFWSVNELSKEYNKIVN